MNGFVFGTSDGAIVLNPLWKPGESGVKIEVNWGAPGEAPYVSLLAILQSACATAIDACSEQKERHEVYREMYSYLRKFAHYFELRADEERASFQAEEVQDMIL